MKNKIIYVVLFILFCAIIAGCRSHQIPTDPALNTPVISATAIPAASGTTTPVATGTAASGTITGTPTQTATRTATPVTPGITPTATSSSHGYRPSTMKIYENSVLQAALTYSYAGGGCTPTSIAESVYDSSGNVTETAQITLDADGNSASAVVRDASNNIISSMTSQISNGVVTRLNSYDASNNLTAYVIYQYDSSNRVTRADTYTGAGLLQGTVFYQYNPNGVTLTESVSPGSTPEAISYTASFTYDGSGRVTSASISAGGVLQESESYTYTASGQIATMSLYDGTGTLQDSISCAYDGSGKLSGMTVTTPMSSGTVAITYDANGNLTDENTSTTVMSMYTITMDIQTTWAAY